MWKQILVTPKKPTTSFRRVRGYSIVCEEDSPITTTNSETRWVVTRDQYDELVRKYNLILATQHATCEYLNKLQGDDAPSLLDELKTDLPSSSRPTITSTTVPSDDDD